MSAAFFRRWKPYWHAANASAACGPNGNQDGRFGPDQERVETALDMASHAIKAKVKCTCAGARRDTPLQRNGRFANEEGRPSESASKKNANTGCAGNRPLDRVGRWLFENKDRRSRSKKGRSLITPTGPDGPPPEV